MSQPKPQPTPNQKRIIVTGGSGKVGRYIISHLVSHDYQVLNLDLTLPGPGTLPPSVTTLKVDLTDSGQVFGALCSHFTVSEPFHDPLQRAPDAVIHCAGLPRSMLVTENETFRVNVQSSFNVIEAACRLGVRKILLASSICAYGVTYAEGKVEWKSFPIDEDYVPHPMDVYGMSKVCMENVASGFATRFGADIYAYRIGCVFEPHEYDTMFARYLERPEDFDVHGWAYTDTRDLAQMFRLGIEKDGLGYQAFNAVNDEITNDAESTAGFLKRLYPRIPHTREMAPREAPLSNRKIKNMLGFREEYKWQDCYKSS